MCPGTRAGKIGTSTRNANLKLLPSPTCSIGSLQAGGTVFVNRFNYNQARQESILTGQNLIPLYNQLGQQYLLNYTTNSHGFTLFTSYPIHRSFARLGRILWVHSSERKHL